VQLKHGTLNRPLESANSYAVDRTSSLKIPPNPNYTPSANLGFLPLYSILQPMAGGFPVLGVFAIKIAKVAPFLAPSYYLVAGTTE
jgi:hypothetical protein